jgi:hypothetical protein
MTAARAARWIALATAVMTGTAAAAPRPPAGQAERIEHRDPTTAPTRGPASALVVVEVFFVPGPSMSSGALRLLQQLQERHPNRVKIVYRVMKSGSSVQVPSAALEAHAQGKFFELMEEIGKQRTVLKREELLEIARRVGLDAERVDLAIRKDRYRDLLDANQRRFERLHAGNLPNVVFNARPSKASIGGLTAADLDRDYEDAYGRALEKLERGFSPGDLAQAFDDDAMPAAQPAVQSSGSPEDDGDRTLGDHPLATPPLRLSGLPAFGKPGVSGRVSIVLLCRPNDASCSNLMRVVEPEVRLYPDDVRVVWAPWFNPARDDASELAQLGDAALCAEAVGSNQGELTTSPGWVWVREMYTQAGRNHNKKASADKLVDGVASKLEVDGRALATCRARSAGATRDWIAAARRSGVPNCESAVIIGGRVYDGLTDQTLIQALVEAELAPGVLGSLPRWHTGK